MHQLPALKTNRSDLATGYENALSVLRTLSSNLSPRNDFYGDGFDRADRERVRKWFPQAKEFIARGGLTEIASEFRRVEQRATNQQIRQTLAMLIGAFPTAQKADLAPYSAALKQHVQSKCPSIFSIEMACWKLRETSRFLPAISEVLEALADAQRDLEHHRRLINGFSDQVAACEKALVAYDEDTRERRLPTLSALNLRTG